MTLASGLGSQFGLSKESTYATIVTPAKFYEFDSETLKLAPTYQDAVGLRAGRTFQPSSRTRQTIRQAGGGVVMDVPTVGFGAILDLMHGLTPTVVQQSATTAWLQTHLIGTSQPNKSATLQFNKPTTAAVDKAFTYPGSVLTAAQFQMDIGGLLKTTLTFDSNDEQSPDSSPTGPALATASYPTGISGWDSTQLTVSLNSATVAVCRSANITWTQPFKADRNFMGNALKGRPIPNGFATVQGTLDIEWFDSSAYALFRSGAMVALSLDLVGPIIASTFHQEIKFAMTAVQVRGDSPNVSGPDVLDLSVGFNAFDDGTNAPLTVTYMSTDTAI